MAEKATTEQKFTVPEKVLQDVRNMAFDGRQAARTLSRADTDWKNRALKAIADDLESNTEIIVHQNKEDVARERDNGMSEAMLDRLALNEVRVKELADAVRTLTALPDPVGR